MDRREAELSDKKKQLEEAEVKRQAMLELQKKTGKREKASAAMGAMSEARREMSKTREQLEEEKNLALSIRIKPIDLDVLDSYELEQKATELYNIVVALETDKYDMEQRALNQEYELTELKERQRLQLRQKAVKKGLDPDALSGKHPPKVRMYSKYERRMDTRTYEDRKTLYDGGWEVVQASMVEQLWTEKNEEWAKRHVRRLPRWFGELPGRKMGDPETPDGEDDVNEEEVDEEEEEDEVEYDEEEEEEYSEYSEEEE